MINQPPTQQPDDPLMPFDELLDLAATDEPAIEAALTWWDEYASLEWIGVLDDAG